VLEGEVASGGMATIYYGRRTDEPPPGTTVAIKRVHPHLAHDRRFSSMFIDEARLVSRIQHKNVVRTVDIIASEHECMLVMEYVHGDSLAHLLRDAADEGLTPSLDVLSAIVCGALDGLEAAHDATNAAGAPLQIVHRDISPQNIIVGADGTPKVLDFGVAKAAGSLQVTRDGEMKGKLAYMSPEQVGGGVVDRRTDVYATGVVLWEAVTHRPLFDGENDAAIIASVLRQDVPVPSSIVPTIPAALDAVIMKALAPDPEQRYQTALAMARALDAAVPRARIADVAEWVDAVAGDVLRERQAQLDDPASGARRARPLVPDGVSEVFVAGRKPAERGTSDAKTPALVSDGAIPLGEDDLQVAGDDRDAQPTKVHPVTRHSIDYATRWWLAAAAGIVLATVAAWQVLKPSPPPLPKITAAPAPVAPP
jgi:serine/threonine-protein kinase